MAKTPERKCGALAPKGELHYLHLLCLFYGDMVVSNIVDVLDVSAIADVS
jgi:hypothetical protein